MQRSIYGLGLIVLFAIAAGACSKASEEELDPPCDTTGMRYSIDILPVIAAHCYSCHGNGTITEGVDLDGYENLKSRADNGDLLGAITHAAGYTPMPYNQPKLSDCDINKIKAWIQSGAPDN
ncbi:MAG: hypothetical protein KF746_15915 [Chitinophagaceae bacterium]|nr:hypothetical protein [Chitinophagaceae bacterium]